MAESGVDVQLNFSQAIRNVTSRIETTPAQLHKASERAIKKTVRWLSGRVARELSQQLGIPQRYLKKRLLLRTAGSGVSKVHILWMGVMPLAAEQTGKPRQTRRGVTVGSRKFDGAFFRAVYNADENVYIRVVRNRRQNYQSLSGKSYSKGTTLDPDLSGRFPIQRIGVEIEPIAAEIFRRLDKRAMERFKVVIEQEINYVVNHEKK